jgi:hypothetical protein
MFPESLRTGAMTPRDVATRTIATNGGDLTNPPARSPNPRTMAIANEAANPSAVTPRMGPRSRATSISSPDRNGRKASPTRARIETG